MADPTQDKLGPNDLLGDSELSAGDTRGGARATLPEGSSQPQEPEADAPLPTYWEGFILTDFSFVAFEPGSTVVDVGCGAGEQLRELGKRGIQAFGLDADRSALAEAASSASVSAGVAEQLPIRDKATDGVVCKVMLPYTDEDRAMGEIARVLKPGGKALMCYHGFGYYLRYLLKPPEWRNAVYAIRTIANTVCFRLVGRRFPTFLGDTLYQSRARLSRYYDRYDLNVVEDTPSKRFLGAPVFIYHTVQKRPPGPQADG